MHSSIVKRVRIAAMLFLVLGVASSAWATCPGPLPSSPFIGGIPWQVGDVVACFGTGTCNVLRIDGSPVLLDQISDLPQSTTCPPVPGVTNQGGTRGVAINNTLHLVVTDNGAGSDSNVVVYSIASVDPTTGTKIAHTPVNISNASPNNAQAIVVNKFGHIFVGNAGGNSAAPTIVELNPDGTLATSSSVPPKALPSNPFTLPGNCTDVKGHLLSMDLSQGGSSLYLTSTRESFSPTDITAPNGGSIQKLTFSSPLACTPFALFGNGVALNGIQDVPPGALAAVSPNCNGTTCPSDETILVVAEGFFESDGDSNAIPDSGDDVNICTNAVDGVLVSCALLLDTGGPGLTASPWVANNQYFDTTTKILDANLHVQQVATPGTSSDNTVTPHPAWSTNGGTIVDNQVTWTDGGPAPENSTLADWAPNTPYCSTCFAGTQIRDSVTGNIQNATTPGTSGPASARPSFKTNGGTTPDGLTWTDQGTSVVARYPVSPGGSPVSTLQALSLDPLLTDCTVNNCSAWQASHGYALGATILDPASHVQKVTTAGTSGSAQPTFNDSGGTTSDGGVTWTDQGRTSASNFWIGDNGSANFYKLDFATGAGGTPTAISANANAFGTNGVCLTCSTADGGIQGLRIYGGEGANQPDLTKLYTNPSFPAGTPQPVKFPLPVPTMNDTNTNTMTVEIFPTSASPIPLSIYASQLPMASAVSPGNNSGASDNGFSCEPTTSNKANCIVWKIDANPPSTSTLATKFSTVNTTAPTIDKNTDVFVDENYDVTTFVGNFDPGGGRISVHSLHEVAAFANATVGGSCAYTSPAPKCFQNPGNITFKFSCPTFNTASPSCTTGTVQCLQPRLSLVTPPPGTPGSVPQPILPLTPTGTNLGNYRFTGGQWAFNWQAQNGVFRATTVDLSHQVQTFFEDFQVGSCSTAVTISSVTPNFGPVAGGAKVTIAGVGYLSGATVTFGGAMATGVKVASNGKSITAITPQAPGNAAGVVDVTVTNLGSGGSATFFGGYTYQ